MNWTLPRWNAERFEIAPDPALLARLTADMEKRGGAMRPDAVWMLPDEMASGTIAGLLDAWNGTLGLLSLAELLDPSTAGSPKNAARVARDVLPYYDQYLRSIDHAGLLDGVSLADLAAANWRLLDLDSLMDVLLLSAFADLSAPDQLVVEIGGGFGRLIEFVTLLSGQRMRYVNVDAVPASLMYCRQYLQARFPERRVRLFGQDVGPGDDAWDFLVVPAWELDRLRLPPADLAINIESMQEMNQALVDRYIGLIDASLREDGIVFLNNARDYLFVGDWVFPDHWQCLFRHRTARSWTADQPTEIFRKTARSQRAQNMLRGAAYWRELRAHDWVGQHQKAAGARSNHHGIDTFLTPRTPGDAGG